jgi:uncharacterized metal-binding protein YceD (DUF177 family)
MSKSEYVIRFSGLKEGNHQFNFEIGNTFFEQLEYSEVQIGNLTVDVDFEKKVNMLVVSFNLKGQVQLMCDRCTDDVMLAIEGEEELIYKFGEGESIDEKIIFISHNEIEIDLTHPIYELTCLVIPSKRLHPEGQCNQEMLKAMDNYLMVETDEVIPSEDEPTDNEEVDPRWAALNKLKK